MVEEVRVEVFTRQEEAEAISAAIMDAAHTGVPGDGVVAVMPIEKLFLVRTKSEAIPGEFWPTK
jgi:nitrogen regulatory protein P-II 1